MLVAPSAIAAAIDTSTIPRSSSGDVPAFRSAALRRGGQSRLVGGLAEQDRAGVADQARPAAGHLQGMVPPRYPAWRRALQSPGSCIGVVTCNLPEPGRSSPLKPARTAAPRPSAIPAADRPAPIRCTRTQPATARNPSSQRQAIRRTAQLPISAE